MVQQCALLLLLMFTGAPFCLAHAKSSVDSQGAVLEYRTPESGTESAQQAQDYISEVAPDGLYCWPADKMPVKVFFQPADGLEGYKSTYPRVLADSFDEWTRASQGRLSWLEVSQPEQADIVVRWTVQAKDRPTGTEAGNTKTYALVNTQTHRGTIHKADMTLLTRLPEREFTDSEIKRAYLHEVGHAFGIAGHSSKPDDIMFFAVRKNESPSLSDRDIATMNHLYGAYQTRMSVASRKTLRKDPIDRQGST
jgi:predicted Zn-dependent protease